MHLSVFTRRKYQKMGLPLLVGLSLGCPPPSSTKVIAPTNANSANANNTEETSSATPPALSFRPPPTKSEAKETPLLKALSKELERAKKGFASEKQAPYFIGYEVIENETLNMTSILGVLESVRENKIRYLHVDLRVGDFSFDNTHDVRTNDIFARFASRFPQRKMIPVEDDEDAIRAAVWDVTETAYQAAVKQYEFVQANDTVRVEAEDTSDDFSRESPTVYLGTPKTLSVDKKAWEQKLREYSKAFIGHDEILNPQIRLSVDVSNKYLVNSEGSKLQFPRMHVRLSISANTRAEDGMDLSLFETFDAESFDKLPSEKTIQDTIDRIIKDLKTLRAAPLAKPYIGPAIITGRATGVFFHEIFGHRVEGHRQKDEMEGQTFTSKINEKIMPSFISVYDDPTIAAINNIDLNGHYPFDDEGVPGQRATLVDNGIFKGFLLSRAPVKGFTKSNGHGRRQAGFSIVARQGNLVVEAKKTIPEEELRQRLIEEIKKQGKEYGLLFKDIRGGFTNTSRFGTQSFKVLPVLVYRVYADGREDEMIRGADIVGTPLASLGEILAAGDQYEVFNGFCGAESGFVPVSGVGPALLLEKIEVEKQGKGSERPPILPAPKRDGGAK